MFSYCVSSGIYFLLPTFSHLVFKELPYPCLYTYHKCICVYINICKYTYRCVYAHQHISTEKLSIAQFVNFLKLTSRQIPIFHYYTFYCDKCRCIYLVHTHEILWKVLLEAKMHVLHDPEANFGKAIWQYVLKGCANLQFYQQFGNKNESYNSQFCQSDECLSVSQGKFILYYFDHYLD